MTNPNYQLLQEYVDSICGQQSCPPPLSVPGIPTTVWIPPAHMPCRWDSNDGAMPMVKAKGWVSPLQRDESLHPLQGDLEENAYDYRHESPAVRDAAFERMERLAADISGVFADLVEQMDNAVKSDDQVEYQKARLAYHKLVHDLYYPSEADRVTWYGEVIRAVEVRPTIHHGRIHGVLVKVYWNPHSSSSLVHR